MVITLSPHFAEMSAAAQTTCIVTIFFLFFLSSMFHYAINWCDKVRFFAFYICCFIAGFSYRTRLVSEADLTA